jgi:broad specificity phosphatase PhoE
MEGFSNRSGETTILVTHAANIHAMVAWWLGLPVDSRAQLDVAPASLTVLDFNRWQGHSLERLNDCAHLYAAGLGPVLPVSR